VVHVFHVETPCTIQRSFPSFSLREKSFPSLTRRHVFVALPFSSFPSSPNKRVVFLFPLFCFFYSFKFSVLAFPCLFFLSLLLSSLLFSRLVTAAKCESDAANTCQMRIIVAFISVIRKIGAFGSVSTR
jgi:hypothetical protein